MSFHLNNIIRKNVQALLALAKSNNSEDLAQAIRLHMHENALGSPLTKWYNRYPAASQNRLKEAVAFVKKVASPQVSLFAGAAQAIDALFKCCCEPGVDHIIVCSPTHSLFAFQAQLLGVQVIDAPLLDDFQLNLAHLETLMNAHTKMICLASPNPIIGNALHRQDIEAVLNNFDGLVVLDETYINFSRQKSLVQELADYPNLVVLHSFSKAWGLAGLGVDVVLASAAINECLQVVQPAPTIAQPVQDLLLQALQEIGQVNDMITLLVDMRVALAEVLTQMPIVKKVHPSQANFLCVQFEDANAVYQWLLQQQLLVQDISDLPYCNNCLNITIGTEKEITQLVDALIAFMEARKS